MELTLGSMFYLFFRLAPFILVCFFALGSIINGELKGFGYLVGLIFALFVTFMINGALGDDSSDGQRSLLCKSFSINNVYSTKTPASLIIFGYTFFYLVYPIAKHDIALYNIPTLVMFPMLILSDFWWNFSHNCFPPINCMVTFIVGSCCGLAWAHFISQTNMPQLEYYNVGSNRERCGMPTKTRFKCTTYDDQTGQPVPGQ
jgi:hypothetical protein